MSLSFCINCDFKTYKTLIEVCVKSSGKYQDSNTFIPDLRLNI